MDIKTNTSSEPFSLFQVVSASGLYTILLFMFILTSVQINIEMWDSNLSMYSIYHVLNNNPVPPVQGWYSNLCKDVIQVHKRLFKTL